jgi:HD-GYP domain-containing protein (c-di-GMP phosphodiesterase class II)
VIRIEIIRTIYTLIHLRDPVTAQHSYAMAVCAYELAKIFDPDHAGDYYLGGLVHDVGKIGWPDWLLKGEQKVSSEDKKLLIRHVSDGVRFLSQLNLPPVILQMTQFHHERNDGTGYPTGVFGKYIPISGKIAAVSDVYSALRMDRPYRKGIAHEEAIAIMEEDRGLDRFVLARFKECYEGRKSIENLLLRHRSAMDSSHAQQGV